MNKPTKNSLKRQARKKSKRVSHQQPSSHEVDASTLLAIGLQFHKQGDFERAKNHYVRLIKSYPTNSAGWHLLGMAMFSTGQGEEAKNCLLHALEFSPDNPSMLSNLGLVHRGNGDLQNAEQALQRAVELQPNSAEFRNNLGTVLLERNKFDTAETCFEQSLEIQPEFVTAAMNLGNVWQKLGRMNDAENIYRRWLRKFPDDNQLLTNLGECLRAQCKWEEAIVVLSNSLKQSPDNVEARINLARCLRHRNKFPEAQHQLSELIRIRPECAKAYHYLGQSFLDEGNIGLASENVQQALRLDPEDVFAKSTMGEIYLETGQFLKAEESFKQVIDVDPSLSVTHSFYLYLLSRNPSIGAQELFDEHQRWGDLHGNFNIENDFLNDRDPSRCLKIGYVSPDFRKHAVAYFITPILECHDSSNVEVFGYAESNVEDETTEKIRSLCDFWRTTNGLSDDQLASLIRTDQIDILIDLAGHTARNRLTMFARRPAPVQVTWIGYPNTTGLKCMDYRLTCEIQDPPDEPSYHTEELVRFPSLSFRFTTPKDAPEIGSLPAASNGVVTFGSLHRPFKISEVAVNYWAGVLQRCANSKLILFNTHYTEESSSKVISRLSCLGIEPSRIEIRNSSGEQSYLRTYDEIDIGLDVTPWAGATTTMEALWMGVPVIAINGDRRSARSTAAIVNAVGVPELIANNQQQYAEIAFMLANDLPKLKQLRANLRRQVQLTVLDSNSFTRDLESEFRKMWLRWCSANCPGEVSK